jgi:hypothetical protein
VEPVTISLGGVLPRAMPPVGLEVPAAFAEDALLASDLLAAVDFPHFVLSLIQGVTEVDVDAAIRQMDAYAELVARCGTRACVLEAVIPCRDAEGRPTADLRVMRRDLERLAAVVRRAGADFDLVAVSPACDLKSCQPTGPWPPAPDLADLYDAARELFPGARDRRRHLRLLHRAEPQAPASRRARLRLPRDEPDRPRGGRPLAPREPRSAALGLPQRARLRRRPALLAVPDRDRDAPQPLRHGPGRQPGHARGRDGPKRPARAGARPAPRGTPATSPTRPRPASPRSRWAPPPARAAWSTRPRRTPSPGSTTPAAGRCSRATTCSAATPRSPARAWSPSETSAPRDVQALAAATPSGSRIWLSNLTGRRQRLRIEGAGARSAEMRCIDTITFERLCCNPDAFDLLAEPAS